MKTKNMYLTKKQCKDLRDVAVSTIWGYRDDFDEMNKKRLIIHRGDYLEMKKTITLLSRLIRVLDDALTHRKGCYIHT